MELCWLTTDDCNQNCSYCDRFHKTKSLDKENYITILDKLISYGIKYLTFGGGESLLLNCFDEIVKKSYQNGIHIKLVTNGKLIPQNSNLIKYFDEITLSIDSLDSVINKRLGRGETHFDNICTAIETIKSVKKDIFININSVVTKINSDDVINMSNQIMTWNIQQWRIFRFCPLRETALKNRSKFEILDEQFLKVEKAISNLNLDCKVQFRNYTDMEKDYLLITPDGKLCVSHDMQDIVVGDMITDNLASWFIK